MPKNTVRAEPFDVAQDRLVEARFPSKTFDKSQGERIKINPLHQLAVSPTLGMGPAPHAPPTSETAANAAAIANPLVER